MSTRAPSDLLIEIGTEELPPKALRRLSEAFTNAIIAGLKEGRWMLAARDRLRAHDDWRLL